MSSQDIGFLKGALSPMLDSDTVILDDGGTNLAGKSFNVSLDSVNSGFGSVNESIFQVVNLDANKQLNTVVDYQFAFNNYDSPMEVDAISEISNLHSIRVEQLTEEDLECLTKFSGRASWLNNDIIMCYLIHQLSKIDPQIMIVEIAVWREKTGIRNNWQSIFCPELKQSWSKVFFPIFVRENHWTLAVVNTEGNCDFYDSLGGSLSNDQQNFIKQVMSYLQINQMQFNLINRLEYYQQKNDHSCGPAICMFAERLLNGHSLKFRQIDVNNWRKSALRIMRDEVLNANENGPIDNSLNQGNNTRKRKSSMLTLDRSLRAERDRAQKRNLNLTQEQQENRKERDSIRKRRHREDSEKREIENYVKNKLQNLKRLIDKKNEQQSFVARSAIEDEDDVLYFDCGDLSLECKYCNAKFFKGEHVANTPKGTFSKCCSFGKIELENAFDDYPLELYDLLTKTRTKLKKKTTEKSETELFHEKPRNYNSAFAFASMKAQNFDRSTLPYAYRIQGQIYHTVNLALHPDLNERPSYAQLFILDTEESIQERMNNKANRGCDENVMRVIEQSLYQVNPYYHSFKMMFEVEREVNQLSEQKGEEAPEIRLLFDINNVDKRRFNVPKFNEVAAVFVLDSNNELPPAEKLAIHQRGKMFKSITKFEKRAESMLFPIYFPTGKGGCGIELRNKMDKKITFSQYYRYMTSVRMTDSLAFNQQNFEHAKKELYGRMIKDDEKTPLYAFDWNKEYDDHFSMLNFNPIRLGGKLYQQYLVDGYVKVEQDRLDYIRFHQKELKSEKYQSLHDYVKTTADDKGKNVGKTFVLPSSFKGSPRHCQQGYQDSMAIVRRFGKPSLFITFTCNPNWPEVQRNLLPGNKAMDEPDLIDRVFNMKFKELMKDLKVREVCGKVVAYTYVIEFQKRGLPHAHILLILDKSSKISTPEEIDETVSAEIPDENVEPRLYLIITQHMMHGPCGAHNKNCPCMEEKNGKLICSKNFPKEFREKTEIGNDSYAQYKRRDNGRTFETSKGVKLDNRWVVPYNKYLSLKYSAHINVEICASVKSVKYLYKYVYKGHDCARIVISVNGKDEVVHDEIKKYVDMRYLTSHEAFWRIFELPLDEKSHSITRLDLHLPDQQIVIYSPDKSVKEILEKAANRNTTLTAWFELNKKEPQAKNLYYYEIPEDYTFKKDDNTMIWALKGGVRGNVGKPCLGRMYTAHPKQGELFYLRMLLLHVKGAESWQDLLTVEEVVYATFQDAVKAMGLLEDENEWFKYFSEASTYASPLKLRELFASVLTHGELKNAKDLWLAFQENMYEDYVYHGHSVEKAQNLAKAGIEYQLQINGCSLIDFGIEVPDIQFDDTNVWSAVEEQEKFTDLKLKLNEQQKEIIDHVVELIEELEQGKLTNGCVNIDGPAGSGKTFTYETICRYLRSKQIKYKTSCWMGIAANLMLDGRTMHKNFGLPFNVDKDGSSSAKPNNKTGRELLETQVFIIDEISMVPKFAMEIIDKKLKELHGNNLPFGGVIMIIGGDYRQILPIQKRAGRDVLVSLSVTQSSLWNYFQIFRLKTNQRVLTTVEGDSSIMQEKEDFADWVLKVGNDEIPKDENEYIEIPQKAIATRDLIFETFGDYIGDGDLIGMSNRVILTTTNERAREINDHVLEMIQDNNVKTYLSVDKIDKEEFHDFIEYPPEFLHSLNESGLPPHELKLKRNCPVMLKRNLNPAAGLCNGTRLRVKEMHRNMLECEFMFGPKAGERVLIPRITVTSAAGNFPFTLYRKQFPVQLCFGITINKSQGQTIDFVGLDLVEPVFAHGMTYVALSRVRGWESLKVAVKPEDRNKIKNVVWTEVLLRDDNERNYPNVVGL